MSGFSTNLRAPLLALLVACRAEEPPVAPAPALAAEPTSADRSVETASAAPLPKPAPPPLVPIPLERFEDGARHYRNANGISEYPRYLPEQYVAIAENILLHQRSNGGWRENWDPARILDETEKRAVHADESKSLNQFVPSLRWVPPGTATLSTTESGLWSGGKTLRTKSRS